MRICSLDFESSWSTPVNPLQCRITEIGAVLFDWEAQQPLKIYSDFINEEDHPPSPKELVDLTGITDDMKKEWGVPLAHGLINLRSLMGKSDYVVAHNGNEFDKPLLFAEAERVKVSMRDEFKWLDTKVDIEYSPKIKSTKLTYLCAEHGFINPFAHRALSDAQSVLKLMSFYDINKMIEMSKQETVKAVASVSYENKHLARERGYYWDGELKRWWKSLKESQAKKEQEQAPFQVQILRSK